MAFPSPGTRREAQIDLQLTCALGDDHLLPFMDDSTYRSKKDSEFGKRNSHPFTSTTSITVKDADIMMPVRSNGLGPSSKSPSTISSQSTSSSLWKRKRLGCWLVLGLIHDGAAFSFHHVITTPQQHYSTHRETRTRQFAKKGSVSGDSSNAEASSAGKPGWRRRVLSRFRRNQDGSSLEARSTLQREEETVVPPPFLMTNHPTVDSFIMENFERLSPEQLFSTLEQSNFVLDGSGSTDTSSVFFETPIELPLDGTSSLEQQQEQVDLLDCAVAASQIGATSSFEGGPLIRKMARNWFQNMLTNCFSQWAAEEPVNLQVRCSPTGAVLPALLRGQFFANARVDFDRIVFPFIQCSGGGSIEGSSLALNLLAFTVDRSAERKATPSSGNSQVVDDKNAPSNKKRSAPKADSPTADSSRRTRLLDAKKASPRYLGRFDLHANDCTFTQEDLFASRCLRNGLQNLVKRIMKRRGFRSKSVVVSDISILDNGKISCKGQANVDGMIPKVSFEVRSGIAFKNRGHVIAFPGLELSLSPDMGLFVPIPNVELDVGHNARMRELVIDGTKKFLKLGFSVTITPEHTRKLSEEYTQCSDSFSAKFFYDVGRWLTRIGRFSL
ncbi:expressed unknown protein [Seminavis robusta]|uniref:Uncharacterized protein n=1 Tax=Seminavis robusta TaxID=568900 RepID=A0A9N8EMS6_9STRA|nr:expressed unknown protein [Seminavis robusta]|eukprot:Sro1353_g265340.1 n/a (613) ;mRNA; f:1985-3823